MNDEGGEQKQDSASRTWIKHVSWLSFPTEYGNCYKCIWFRSEPSMGSWRLKCFFMVKKSRKRSFWSSERKEGLLVGEEAEKEEWRYPVWSAVTWARPTIREEARWWWPGAGDEPSANLSLVTGSPLLLWLADGDHSRWQMRRHLLTPPADNDGHYFMSSEATSWAATEEPRQGPGPWSLHRLAQTLQQYKTITSVKYSCQHTLWFWWNVQSLDMSVTESRNLARPKNLSQAAINSSAEKRTVGELWL